MSDLAERERPAAKGAEAIAPAGAGPDRWEKLRLRFELELMESQDAGAALEPLLRRGRRRKPPG